MNSKKGFLSIKIGSSFLWSFKLHISGMDTLEGDCFLNFILLHAKLFSKSERRGE